ncbi:MAG: choice-of-anchor M domain-containing protein, partial [Bifidobacteriaceae bacterium]|nr:choice-of-anchor M domain-containing protein [Bifidobacteriaceae bacterium]
MRIPRQKLTAVLAAGGLALTGLAVAGGAALAEDTDTVSLGGVIFEDLNHNGVKDEGETGIDGAFAIFIHPETGAIRYPDNPLLSIRAYADEDGGWQQDGLPLTAEGEPYTVRAVLPSTGYVPTVAEVKINATGKQFDRKSGASLSVAGASDLAVDFPLSEPWEDEPEPEDPDAVTVLTVGHADVLYPEIDTAADGSKELVLRAHGDVMGTVDYDNLVMVHPDESIETLPEEYSPWADYSFVGEPGSTVWQAGQSAGNGGAWIGAAVQSPTLAEAGVPADAAFSFRLEAVTGSGGAEAPGEVVLWMDGAVSNGHTLFSTVKGLPASWSLPKGVHSHFNWTYTAPGVYCLAFSVQADVPGAGRQIDRQILTHVIGSGANPAEVEPCGRTMGFPAHGERTVLASDVMAPYVSSSGNAAFAVDIVDGQLDATFNQEAAWGDGPDTAYEIDDVIMHGVAGQARPYQLEGDPLRIGRRITWDTAQVDAAELASDITWEITGMNGPGDLTASYSSEWADQQFDTAEGVLSQDLWPEAKREWLRWDVTRPGK